MILKVAFLISIHDKIFFKEAYITSKYSVLDKTLKGIRGMGLDICKVIRAPGKTKFFRLFVLFSTNLNV